MYFKRRSYFYVLTYYSKEDSTVGMVPSIWRFCDILVFDGLYYLKKRSIVIESDE